MEPTDNFSQKKKKDLVAIATLFGILTEEKANRMTKPELIEFLAEQDRISKAASTPVQKQAAINAGDAPLRAADLLLAAIENSKLLSADDAVQAKETAPATPAPVVSTPAAPVIEKPAPAAAVPAVSEVPAVPILEAPISETIITQSKTASAKPTSVRAPKTAPAAKAAKTAEAAETITEKKQTKPAVSPKITDAQAAMPAAKTGRKSAAASSKKPAEKPRKDLLTVSEPDFVSEKEPLSIPAGKPESKETPQVTAQEISIENIPAVTPAVIPVVTPVVTPAVSTTADAAVSAELPDNTEPVQKKRRGRPKKTSEETETAAAVSVSTAEIQTIADETGNVGTAVTAETAPAKETSFTAKTSSDAETKAAGATETTGGAVTTSEEQTVISRVKPRSHKEIIAQEEMDPQEVISAEVEVVSDMDGSSGENINYEAPENRNYQPEQPNENIENKPQSQEMTADAVHHTIRTKRHSVIIKPKDEDTSELDGEVPAGTEPAGEQRTSSAERKDSDESSGFAAASGDHAEFGPHHRTLRPKEQQQEMLSGVLEIMSEGYGFLRRENYLQGLNDIYVPAQYVRRFGLRVGDFVIGPCRPKRDADRYQALQYIKEVNGLPPERMLRRVHFDRLTPIYPQEKYILETDRNELSTRIIDLVAPIGKGQRGMIVSPPKAGKTILLQKIANAISINNPDSKLIVLLIDERPEEVTDMQRSINGEVVYSTFDKTPENHVRIVELVLERAMRLVELGLDVIILLDSITRLARAYNLTINPTGRTLSGGLDPGALYGPKRFFGAARNIENGGSLTIVATSLIDTGSRMDEVIFEEFKGTGNMEVYLDRKLSEKRIFPAIDINKSGTRHEELLLSPVELDAVWTIRKAFGQLDTSAVTEMIISLLMKTATNNQLTQSINVSFNDKATFDAMRGTRPAGNSTNSGNGK